MKDLFIIGRLIAFIAFPIGLLFLLLNPFIAFFIIIASTVIWNLCGHYLKKEHTLEEQNANIGETLNSKPRVKQLNEKTEDVPQEVKTETDSSKLPSILHKFHNKPRLILEIIGIILILSLAASLFGKVSKDDYESLKSDYDSLQSDHETLEAKYNSLQSEYSQSTSDLESTKTTLNDTLSVYAEYQTRMQPFDSLTEAEEAAAQAQAEAQAEAQATAQAQAEAAPQQAQGSMVWIPRTGSKYHRSSSCSNMKSPTQVTLSEAQAVGYEPCKKCY